MIGPSGKVCAISAMAVASLLVMSGAAQAYPILEQVSPSPTTYVFGVSFNVMVDSPVADVTAAIQAVDVLNTTLPSFSTSGCEAADFAGFAAGRIALLERGTCNFWLKAANAQAAGATGVLVFNRANEPTELFQGILGGPVTITIPVFGLTRPVGVDLATSAVPVTMRMFDDGRRPSVPEPASLALLGAGLVALAGRRNWRA